MGEDSGADQAIRYEVAQEAIQLGALAGESCTIGISAFVTVVECIRLYFSTLILGYTPQIRNTRGKQIEPLRKPCASSCCASIRHGC